MYARRPDARCVFCEETQEMVRWIKMEALTAVLALVACLVVAGVYIYTHISDLTGRVELLESEFRFTKPTP